MDWLGNKLATTLFIYTTLSLPSDPSSSRYIRADSRYGKKQEYAEELEVRGALRNEVL